MHLDTLSASTSLVQSPSDSYWKISEDGRIPTVLHENEGHGDSPRIMPNGVHRNRDDGHRPVTVLLSRGPGSYALAFPEPARSYHDTGGFVFSSYEYRLALPPLPVPPVEDDGPAADADPDEPRPCCCSCCC